MQNICKEWRITNDEYSLLDQEFGQLAEFQAWDLIKRNTNSNHTDEQSDIAQELKIALMKAGSYYKRQVYIELCLSLCFKYVQTSSDKDVLENLQNLWNNKTKHGANKQKFGPEQEKMLSKLVKSLIPKAERPNRDAQLIIDSRFSTYCKSITWNHQHAMGKKITREKQIRSKQVSLSEFDYVTAMAI